MAQTNSFQTCRGPGSGGGPRGQTNVFSVCETRLLTQSRTSQPARFTRPVPCGTLEQNTHHIPTYLPMIDISMFHSALILSFPQTSSTFSVGYDLFGTSTTMFDDPDPFKLTAERNDAIPMTLPTSLWYSLFDRNVSKNCIHVALWRA